MARIFMKGTEAIAEAAVRAGCRFFAGYPITPQNEIPEYFARRLPEVGGNFVQGESEVASVNMVYGAAAAGKETRGAQDCARAKSHIQLDQPDATPFHLQRARLDPGDHAR